MGLISKAWTNLAPPGAMSPPIDLTRPALSCSTMLQRMTYSGSIASLACRLNRSALASHLRFGAI
jgi:hypothetical protein